jgi:hypothetical protein
MNHAITVGDLVLVGTGGFLLVIIVLGLIMFAGTQGWLK